MNEDFFQHKASSYESVGHRVSNVDNIAKSLLAEVALEPSMEIMDFGSGTGLLLEKIAPYVAKITAVDVSASMNAQLEQKRMSIACELEILNLDLTRDKVAQTFDGIVSSMTLHHIADIPNILVRLRQFLNPGGFVAIADLDTEDGSFHTEDTGVFHHGFDRAELGDLAIGAGFNKVTFNDASVAQKPHGRYPVFLMVAR